MNSLKRTTCKVSPYIVLGASLFSVAVGEYHVALWQFMCSVFMLLNYKNELRLVASRAIANAAITVISSFSTVIKEEYDRRVSMKQQQQ